MNELLTIDDLCERLQVSKSWLRKSWKVGKFPAPLHLGRRCQRWRPADVQSWIDSREPAEVSHDA